jgi:hypothetical protein
MRHPQPQIGVGEPAIQRADYASPDTGFDEELAASAPKLLAVPVPRAECGSRGWAAE